MNFIKKIFEKWVCKHKWEKFEEMNLIICPKCGKVKEVMCHHNWEVHREISIWDRNVDEVRPAIIRQTLICQKCGKIKQIEL